MIVMSATLEVQVFTNYFLNPGVVTVKGRQYPVDVLYCEEKEEDYVDAVHLTILQVELYE